MSHKTISVLSVLCFAAAACGSDEPPRSDLACTLDPSGAPLTTAQVLEGPYAVGRTSYTLVDDSRETPEHAGNPALTSRTLATAVWYPATTDGTDAPVATGGPFPLVAYSHGFSSNNAEGSTLNAVLASHGYVVFAPTFPLSHLGTDGGPTVADIANQPGDVSFVIDSALAMSAETGQLLEGAVDPERIAAVGLSLGGLTTLLVTYHATLRDPRIDVAAAMAPAASFLGDAFYDTRVAPTLILSGDIDKIVPYDANAVAAFHRVDPPVNLYTLVGGTHTGFTSVAAALFESADNADSVGCSAIGTAVMPGDGGLQFDIVAALGGEAAGLVAPADVPVCQEPFPYAMRPSRQQDIEAASIASFLDAYLSADAETRGRSCHYHERVLPAEADDVRFSRR